MVQFIFKRTVEYVGERSIPEIFKVITENFVLPSQFASSKFPPEIATNLESKSSRLKPGQAEYTELFVELLDSREVKYSEKKALYFLIHDLLELDYMKNLETSLLTTINQNQKNQKTELINIEKKWSKALEIINKQIINLSEKYKFDNFGKIKKGQVIELGLFSILFTQYKKQQQFQHKCTYVLMRLIQLQRKDINNLGQRYLQQNIIFLIPQAQYDRAKTYLFSINISYNQSRELNHEEKERYKDRPDLINTRKIDIIYNIKDHSSFAQDQLGKIQRKKMFPNQSSRLGQYMNTNQIVCQIKEYKFKRQKRLFKPHYFLAFQGGGAKGLAYVGAYQALKQNKIVQNEQMLDIDIRSIIGSSAGGIISLAVSTGISDYEVQKICYKINTIPIKDRWRKKELGLIQRRITKEESSINEYGIPITYQSIIESIKLVLTQYGILHQSSIATLQTFLNSSKYQHIQDKLIKYLNIVYPTIVKLVEDQRTIIQDHWKITQKLIDSYNYIFNVPQDRDKKYMKINWSGLLLHGSLMKGDAIRSIAEDCLIKYLLKCHFQEENFSTRLLECTQHNRKVDYLLGQHTIQIIKLKKICLGDLERDHVATILVALINQWLNILENYAKEYSPNKSIDLGLIEIVQHQDLNIPNSFIKKIELILESTDSKRATNFAAYLTNPNNPQTLYRQIKANIENKIWFLDPKKWKIDEGEYQQHHKVEIFQFLTKIFKKVIASLGLQMNILLHKIQNNDTKELRQRKTSQFFVVLELMEAIEQVFLQCKQIHQQISVPQQIYKYRFHILLFKESVSKITMKEYYKLTKIELTCTSVDLDDKILRFFNHKTTPKLPVCKAVQMTGSFPVGFKAQRWKREWGNYCVCLSDRIIEFDVTNHEFTDGGMLANFPIKYLHNDDFRRKYFAHQFVENKTILLGFGLDFQQKGSYHPSKQQDELQRINNKKATIALAELNNQLPCLINLGYNMIRGLKGEQISKKWWQIEHSLLQRIPLIRFIFKLLDAYPNADRKLNLEVFKNRVVFYTMPKKEQQQQISASEESRKKLFSVLQFHNRYRQIMHNMRDRQIQIIQATEEQNLEILKQNAVKDNLKLKLILEESYVTNHMEESIRSLRFEQIDQSKQIIRILLLNLRFAFNKQHVKKLTLKYICLRYTTARHSLILDEETICRELNQLSFWQLFKICEFEHIQPCPQQLFVKIAKAKKNNLDQIDNMFQTQYKDTDHKMVHQIQWKLFSITRSERRLTQLIYFDFQYEKIRKLNLNEDQEIRRVNQLRNYIINTNYQSLIDRHTPQYIPPLQIIYFISRFNHQSFHIPRPELVPQFKIFIQEFKNNSNQVFNQQILPKFYIKHVLKLSKNHKSFNISSSNLFRQSYNNYIFQFEEPAREKNELKKIVQSLEDYTTILRKNVEFPIQDITVRIIFARNTKILRQNLYQICHQRLSILNEQKFFQEKLNVQNNLIKLHLFLRNEPTTLEQFTGLIDTYQIRAPFIANISYEFSKKQFLLTCELISIKKSLSSILNQELRGLLDQFFDEFELYFQSIRQIYYLLSQYEINDDNQTNIINQEKLKIQIEQILQGQKEVDDFYRQNEIQLDAAGKQARYRNRMNLRRQKLTKRELKSQILQKLLKYRQIYNDSISKLYELTLLEHNELEESTISSAFIVPFELTYNLAQIVVIQIPQLQTIQNAEKSKFIKIIFDKLKDKQFTIPILNSDLLLSFKATDSSYTSSLEQILTHQNNSKFRNSFSKNIKKMKDKNMIEEEYLNQNQFKIEKYEKLYGLNQKQKKIIQRLQKNQNPYSNENFDVHLIAQSLNNSNEFFSSYYEIMFRHIKAAYPFYFAGLNLSDHVENEDKKRIQRIKAFTCSNYHSVFGFLLALGKKIDYIRIEMYKIRFLTATFQQKIIDYFDSMIWFQQKNRYEEVMNYLRQENGNFFTKMKELNKKDYLNLSLNKEFQQLSDIYDNQAKTLQEMYGNIIDATSSCISDQIISKDSDIQKHLQAVEISKKFAFDYICCLEYNHEFSRYSKATVQTFKKIVSLLFDQFGSLLEGIICNTLIANSPLKVTAKNAQKIAKGILINRLFTIFKLKKYIINHLIEAKLSPNVTLSEFYNLAHRQIFLNISVVNISEQRLEFLNMESMPNMPVWAAILASASIPFFHRYFVANREWETISEQAFYREATLSFMRNQASLNRKTTLYTSANYVSSLPLEYLTNIAVADKMLKQPSVRFSKHFCLAFNRISDYNRLPNYQLYLKYLNIGLLKALSIAITKKIAPWLREKIVVPIDPILSMNPFGPYIPRCTSKKHQNTRYQVDYSINYFKQNLNQGHFTRTLKTLLESNDNFIMKWYEDRLIKLPIKIGTLHFHEIVDEDILNKYFVTCLSQKAEETIERSRQITKTFTHKINRLSIDGHSVSNVEQRYVCKIRVQIVPFYQNYTGFAHNLIKMDLLNHSCWNMNGYNNFVVEYWIPESVNHTKIKRVQNSEILWYLEEGSVAILRFYYTDIDELKRGSDEKVYLTEFSLDLANIKQELIEGNIYDYSLKFGTKQNIDHENNQQEAIEQTHLAVQKINRQNFQNNQNFIIYRMTKKKDFPKELGYLKINRSSVIGL